MEVTLILRPHGHRYDALVNGAVICTSDQPIVDAARKLAPDYPKGTILRVRHEGASFDAFQPAEISEWAKWTYTEGASTPLKRIRFVEGPFPRLREGKSGGVSEA